MNIRECLQQRARLFAYIRAFFAARAVLEVETPVLSPAGNPDPAIHSFSTTDDLSGHCYYLHTSPEFAMKRLLAAGSGCIYQLSKVFRAQEQGRYHNPEFTLLEWYRVHYSYDQLMWEVADLVNGVFQHLGHCTQALPVIKITYQQAYQTYTGIDPLQTTTAALQSYIQRQPWQTSGLAHYDLQTCLDLIMSQVIVPQLGKDQLIFIIEYPAAQAALARLKSDNPLVAERFELYYQGIELANGFQELTDALQQRYRWQAQNQYRAAHQQAVIPIDEHFLAALEQQGLPDCAGVALGIDRLLLLNNQARHLAAVMPFTWENA